MDDCSDTDSFVAAGVGEQLHDGRVYSHSAGGCRYRCDSRLHSGPGCRVAIWAHKPDKKGVRLIRS